MLSLENFERAEEISDVLDDFDALAVTLYNLLGHQLKVEDHRVAGAMINAMRMCRNRAAEAAGQIARSGAKRAS